jgi:hypothetical protein
LTSLISMRFYISTTIAVRCVGGRNGRIREGQRRLEARSLLHELDFVKASNVVLGECTREVTLLVQDPVWEQTVLHHSVHTFFPSLSTGFMCLGYERDEESYKREL